MKERKTYDDRVGGMRAVPIGRQFNGLTRRNVGRKLVWCDPSVTIGHRIIISLSRFQ